MQAIVINQFGGPEQLVLRDIPTPAPAEGEVLIKVKAFGINRALARSFSEIADGHNPTLPDSDVTRVPGRTRAVHDMPVSNDDVERLRRACRHGSKCKQKNQRRFFESHIGSKLHS